MRTELPFFSVIVPTFERPAQLASCLAALAELDYPRTSFEVIIIDDGSRNSPEDIVEKFKESLEIQLFRQPNSGPAAARNFGAVHAKGEFLAFTDDDCVVDRKWLCSMAAKFEDHRSSIVGGRTINALSSNPYSRTSQLIIDVVYEHFNIDRDNAHFFASNNFAVSAAGFREVGGFNRRFITSEDRELCERWRQSGRRLAYAPAAVVRHSHDLTLQGLWRQHFAYGTGAWLFHSARRQSYQRRFKPDVQFYLKLLSAAAQPRSLRDLPRACWRTALLLWSQLANTAGFLSAASSAIKDDKHYARATKQLPD